MDNKVKCPACGERFDADEYLEEGDMISCPMCDEELEVVGTSPIKIRQISMAEDDIYDDDGRGQDEEDRD